MFTPSALVQRIQAGSHRPMIRPAKGVVPLHLGEPDFDTPAPIVDAAVAALREGYTHYIDFSGDPELREALAQRVSGIAGAEYAPDQIFATHGSTAAVTSAILAIANPGDRIVIPDPNYSLYADAAYMAGAEPVLVPSLSDYHLDLEQLERALRDARMLVVCNPCNPTGAVYRKDEMARLVEMIERTGVIVLSDEAYCELLFDGREHVSLLSFPSIRSQVLYCQTFSKTFAMTGWRAGYLAGPREIIKSIGSVNRTYTGTQNATVQRAALAATRIGPKLAEPMRAEYAKRRALMVERANAIEGLHANPPEGTFYLFARYDFDIPSSEMLARLAEGGVAVRAGREFGPTGERHLRFSFATSPENIVEGLRRAGTVFEQLAHLSPV